MASDNPSSSALSLRRLATDLDGTFLPLPDCPDHQAALELFRAAQAAGHCGLVYVTGRHLASVCDVMARAGLPRPDGLIADVGTTIYRPTPEGFAGIPAYAEALADRTGGADRTAVEACLARVDDLVLQPAECQGRFKISYFCPRDATERLAADLDGRLAATGLPYACLPSRDPFADQGLLDILPAGVGKASALFWLMDHAGWTADELVFAGDSGNDLPALTSGLRAIVVANAPAEVAAQAAATLARRGLGHRLFRATLPATSGVLEGCRHFGLMVPARRT